MKNLIFNNKDGLDRFIKKHTVKPLGAGREGASFLMDNGLVLKKLNDEYNPEFVMQFKDLDISSFVFAKSSVIIDNYVNAIFMEYIKGYTLLENVPNNQDLLVLGEQLQKLVEDIKKISELGIWVKDFYPGNIIYNNNGFKIIDTIGYLYLANNNFELDNLYEIMNKLYGVLIKEVYSCNEISSDLLFIGNTNILKNPKEYLKELKNVIEKIGECDITTLGDAKKTLLKK